MTPPGAAVTIRHCDFGAVGAERTFGEICDIYEASIPASERKDRDGLRHMTRRDDYRFLVAEDAGRVLAFAVVYRSAAEPVSLLEYLATAPQARNRGIGGRLLDQAIAGEAGRPVLLEVETPPPGTDGGLEVRRVDFYRRHNARIVDRFAYLLPLKANGMPPPMNILVAGAPDLREIPAETFRRWIADIYENVYATAAGGGAFAAMFGGGPAAYTLL